jgi:hypothetical protein
VRFVALTNKRITTGSRLPAAASIGFKGSSRVVAEWATRRRRAETARTCGPRKCPSSRVIARMITIARDQLSKDDGVTIATIEAAVPALVAARGLFDRFQATIRQRKSADLSSWLQDAASACWRPSQMACGQTKAR